MQVRLIVALLASAFMIGDGTQPREYRPIEALYMMSGPTLIDPSPDERVDRLVLHIRGDAAREMFEAMPMEATQVNCQGVATPSGLRRKVAGNLICEFSGGYGYACNVSILLATVRTAKGSACGG